MHTHAYMHDIYRPSTFYFKQPSSNPYYSCMHLVLLNDLQSPAVAMDATYTLVHTHTHTMHTSYTLSTHMHTCSCIHTTYAPSHAHTFTHADTNVHTKTLAH